MSDRNPCVNCHRSIDSLAKACPFCGWDQHETPPPRVEPMVPAEPDASAPVPRFPLDQRLLGAIGIAALLILVFIIGALVHGREPNEPKAPTPALNAQRAKPRRYQAQKSVVPGESGDIG